MQKPETTNKTLPTRLPPVERQQKGKSNPGWRKDTAWKGL